MVIFLSFYMWNFWANQCAYFKVFARYCQTELLEGYIMYILNALFEDACLPHGMTYDFVSKL